MFSVALCLFVLLSRVAHLFSALCCIVFVVLLSRVAHLFSALCCIVFVCFVDSCCSSF